MEYGNAAWGLRELPLEEQLKLTQAMGLHLLELSIANYHRMRCSLTHRRSRSGRSKRFSRNTMCVRTAARPPMISPPVRQRMCGNRSTA